MRGKERERTDEDEVLHLRLKSPSSAPHPLHRFEIPHSHHIADYILVAGDKYPQSIKRLGHLLAADCKSAGTPNGGKGISDATKLP